MLGVYMSSATTMRTIGFKSLAFVQAYFLLKYASGSGIMPCCMGYSKVQPAEVKNFPTKTVDLKSRSSIECAVQCLQAKACLQSYYDASQGTCHVVENSIPLILTSASNVGSLISMPTPTNYSGKLCSSVSCPTGSVCKPDCSATFGGPLCIANNGHCAQTTEIMNSRHYYSSTYEDHTMTGVVQAINFTKSGNDTALRIQWYATTRSHSAAAGCGRHYVSFNGTECSNPAPIDIVNYGVNINSNQHHMSEIDGLCYGIPAGMVTIAIKVEPCKGYPGSDSDTGTKAGRTLWIKEIKHSLSEDFSECTALPVFNTQYSTTTASIGGGPATIMTMVYNKTATDTDLRVKYLAVAGVTVLRDGSFTDARWYVTVNGTECSPKVEFGLGAFENAYNTTRSHQRTRTLSGLCTGLPPGVYSIAVNVGYLTYSQNLTTLTGWNNSTSRLIIDEVRIGSNVQAVITDSGQILKLASFNYRHWSYSSLDMHINNGNLLNVTYAKWSDTSGLHLHMVGDATLYLGQCCRWYFTIDGAECSQPGAIEGIAWSSTMQRYRKPGVIDGVCYGIKSGIRSLSYKVNACAGCAVGDCYTGYNLTLHIMAEEVQPDSAVTCSTPFSCS